MKNAIDDENTKYIDSLKRMDSFEDDTQPIVFDKEVIFKLEQKIINLKNVLDKGFKMLTPEYCEKITIVLGNTGCGKSTLLSSMVLGSDALEI